MRRCADCRECCIVMSIEEIEKPHDTACPHLCQKGCGIYPERPDECRQFTCMWRESLVPSWMKPNKVHAVIWPGTADKEGGKPIPIIRINFNKAFRMHPRVYRWAKKISHKYLVIMARGDRFHAMLNGEIQDVGRDGDSWEMDFKDGRIVGVRVEAA